MSKKNTTPDSKPHAKKMDHKIKSVFSSNEVTLFDLEENEVSTNKCTEKNIAESILIEKPKNSDEEDITLKFNLQFQDSSPPKEESTSNGQSIFEKNDQALIELEQDKKQNEDVSTITFLHSPNNEIIFDRIDNSTHEELEDLFEDIPTPSYLFDNDAVDFNKDTQLITRKVEDVETQVMPIIRKPIISKSVKDLFPSIEAEQPIEQKRQNDPNIEILPGNIIKKPKELPPHNNKKTILSTDSSVDFLTSANKASDISEQIPSIKLSKETLDISKLDPTETLDELLAESSEQDLHQKNLGTSSNTSNTNESDDVHKSTGSIGSEKDSGSDKNGRSNKNDDSDEDRESLLFQNNLKYDVDRDVSDMMTKPFKRTSGYELPKRYTYTELLGLGGMGEVIRVKDDVLCRYVAMKIIRQDFANHNVVLSRFREEAQITAQLCHPNIIPVYELGKLPDGRSFFTMKEVDGDTLDDVIADLHLATKVLPQESEIPIWGESDQGFAFRDVIDIFHRVCVAIAYAHTQGVIHRDLKPENIMIGSFGEVLVMDWGIAKVLESNSSRNLPEINVTNRRRTRMGAVSGTPSYMSKEQALGLVSEIGTHSDVFSLGIILYEILNGKPPYVGSPQGVLEQARKGDKTPPIKPPAPVPEGLIQIMKKATHPDWKNRYPTAKEFADDLRKWMIGLDKKAKGRKKVKEALEKEKELQALRETQKQIMLQKQELHHHISDNTSTIQKHKLWNIEDQERDIRLQLIHLEQKMLQMLRSALIYDPDLTEALQALADYHYKRHNALSIEQNIEAEKHLVELAYYDQGKYHNYLSGDGQCHLQTNTLATASIFRFCELDRRLVSVFERDIGTTPLTGISLEMGSYILQLKAPNYETLSLPIYIPRGEIYMNKNPISGIIEPIQLLEKGTLEDSECYVPGGWCIQGVISNKLNPYRNIWVKSFIIQKFPVTNNEYIQFLNDISKQEGLEQATLFANRRMDASLIYATKHNGQYTEFFIDDLDKQNVMKNSPVIGVNYFQAEKYADWYAKKTGKSWRLPTTTEWEKAALGVDGRLYPWGNHLETTYLHIHTNTSDKKENNSALIESFPLDCSVYGVRGLAGNVQDWCSLNREHIKNITQDDSEQEVIEQNNATMRGGSWKDSKEQIYLKILSISQKSTWTETTSFRLVKDID